jgi:hypothetical protein
MLAHLLVVAAMRLELELEARESTRSALRTSDIGIIFVIKDLYER